MRSGGASSCVRVCVCVHRIWGRYTRGEQYRKWKPHLRTHTPSRLPPFCTHTHTSTRKRRVKTPAPEPGRCVRHGRREMRPRKNGIHCVAREPVRRVSIKFQSCVRALAGGRLQIGHPAPAKSVHLNSFTVIVDGNRFRGAGSHAGWQIYVLDKCRATGVYGGGQYFASFLLYAGCFL